VGSVLSVTGNPQNMLVGIWSGASFGGFMLRMLPVAVGGLLITYIYIRWAFRASLAEAFPQRLTALPIDADRPLIAKGLAMFLAAVVAWLAGGSLPLVAIACGAVMVAIAQRDPGDAIERVDWDLLLLFSALFVVMRGLEASGAVTWINDRALDFVHRGSEASTAVAVATAMLVLSALISNVPAVILWRDVVPSLPDPSTMWLVVAMSSTFAGNLILIGSVANLIVAERAQARGVTLGFVEYARVGIPVTLLTLGWGLVALLVIGAGPR
jgi:Na+/H+ antiporter NhaD/arsenite permease-like protein